MTDEAKPTEGEETPAAGEDKPTGGTEAAAASSEEVKGDPQVPLKQLRDELREAKARIQEFEDAAEQARLAGLNEVEQLKEELRKQTEALTRKEEERIAAIKVGALRGFLTDSHNPSLVLSLVDMAKISEENAVDDARALVEEIRKTHDYLFKPATVRQNGSVHQEGAQRSDGKDPLKEAMKGVFGRFLESPEA